VNYSAGTLELNRIFAKPRYPLTPLRKLATVVQYGISARASEQEIGFPILRMNNLQNDGWDLGDLKYIELSESEARTYKLENGDILFNRTNSKELVGKCEVFREEGHWVFASYLIRVRLDTTQAEPDFVSMFLNTPAGRVQIDRVSRQIIGMSNINAEELLELHIAVPPLPVQQQMVVEMERVRKAWQRRLEQANAMLSGLDAFVFDRLGIGPTKTLFPRFFAARLRDSWVRCDPDYHSPKFKELRRAIDSSHDPVYDLGTLAPNPRTGFAAGREVQSFDQEEGIPHVRPLNITRHGELTFKDTKLVPRDAVEPDDMLQPDEVLLNNTNSTEWVGKTTVFEGQRECCCSNHITRLTPDRSLVLPWFLAALLNAMRSTGYLGLLATNFVNQAGINTETLCALRLPVPSLDEQQKIVAELMGRRNEARRLREEAAGEWEAAKARFEARLLGREGAQ